MTTASPTTTVTDSTLAAWPNVQLPTEAPDRAEFSSLLRRSDQGCSHADLALARPAAYDASGALTGSITDSLPLIVRAWEEVSPDPGATDAMAAVLITFAGIAASQHSIRYWPDIPSELAHQFVREDGLDDSTARLAKNTIHAAYLALAVHGVPTGYDTDPERLSPVHGLLPVSSQVRIDQRGTRLGTPATKRSRHLYDQQVHVRAATHDEVILARLAAPFTHTSRTRHLAAAALAACSSSATTSEAPQILWQHLDLASGTITLSGRPADRGWAETAIAARTNDLDPWDATTLEAWRTERSRQRPVEPAASMLYNGSQPPTSNSAQICADQQVRKLLHVADLRREPGLSAGSFRYWAAARHAARHGLTAAGLYAGVLPSTLHRQLFQLGERSLPPC